MKNKMKAWRKPAEKINEEEGKKHQGRANKEYKFQLPKYVVMSDLIKGMFSRVGLPVGVVA